MKVIEHLKKAKSTLFSYEILPPLKGKSVQKIYDTLDPLMEFNPPFVDVTYHREEFIYKKMPGGYLKKISVRKRPGTVGICAAIIHKYNVDAIPHLICGGFSKEETENALIDLNFLGIHNVLVIRGDARPTERNFSPEEDGHDYAIDLLRAVVNMNNGIYLDDELQNGMEADFCVGVAGYPEKHFEAPNLQTDLKFLKEKVDAGAEYIVTQMFFDNMQYIEFVKACKDMGIKIPIIPGIKPITTVKQVQTLPRAFFIDLPSELTKEVEKCKNNDDAMKVGVEWSIQQCKELVEFGAPCIHFYTMSRPDATKEIVKALV
ncbi:MAG: methylenetetrahydrofolate reductase [NAD(P)H] [Bacteroidia bacterium]|nr:methylenetetrahydrofolate reductase [NAD(P)H] [Bacteroidia bacterium]MBN4052334.1 methylenetetrahydrofolate reductase [NAD(P)H] [Sphingobacteriaceae bacterium AH-315-L07]